MRRTALRTSVLVLVVGFATIAAGTSAHGETPRDVVWTASSGIPLPEGATLLGKVTAPQPAGGGHQIDMSALSQISKRVPPPPCVAKEAWAVSGSALTGWVYSTTDWDTGFTQVHVMWATDDGDWDPEQDEGVVAFASSDCATKLVVDWSIYDFSAMPNCLPDGARSLGDTVDGPFTEPVYFIFAMSSVQYFTVDPASNDVPCTRLRSKVVFSAKVSYVEKNRSAKVLIGCYQRTWDVTFAPNLGDDPMRPEPHWLTVGAASPETPCAGV